MTVEELREMLSLFPATMEVYYPDHDFGDRAVGTVEQHEFNSNGPQIVRLDR